MVLWVPVLLIILVLDYGYIAKHTKSVKIKLRRLSSAETLVIGKNEDSWEKSFVLLKRRHWLFPGNRNPAPRESKSTQNTRSILTNKLTEKFALARS